MRPSPFSPRHYTLARTSFLVVLLAALAPVFTGVSAQQPAPSATPSSDAERQQAVQGKYVRKGKPTDFLELGADRKCTLLQEGRKLEGRYTVQGDTLTLTSPMMLVPALATFITKDVIRDTDGMLWEREPVLNNEEVVKLVAADLGDEIVIAKVKNAQKVSLDVSTDALIALKKAKVSSAIVAAMIERAARPADNVSSSTPPRPTPAAALPTPAPQNPCGGVELLGIFKEDMRPVSPLIIYLAKIRNGTNVTRMVTLRWLNMYAEELQSSVEISAGQIATLKLAAQEPFQRQPINLKISSCR